MTYAYTATERKRVSFGKIPEAMELPNLISVQRESFERFKDEGLREAFKESSPIQSQNHVLEVTFGEHQFGDPAHTVEECREKDMTYQAPLLTDVRLTNKETGEIKEQLVFMGDFPMMTDQGTFIINGTERVIVNQLQRSPGIIFEHDGGKTHTSRKVLYSCRVIPMRGSWLDFDFDHKDILYVRIDRRRKMPATILLKAMGMSKTEILDCFYKKEIYELEDDGRVSWHFNPELHRKEAAFADIVDKEGNVLVKAGKPITKRAWRQMEAAGVEKIEVAPETPLGLFLAEDLVDNATGEILAEAAD